MTIREMLEYSGLTQKAFSEKYKIKLRTLEDWLAGHPPKGEHVLYLLERCVRMDYGERRKCKSNKIQRI